MDTIIEKLGGPDEIAKYIQRDISLQTIAKKNGIKRFGPATEKKVIDYYEKYHNSSDIISKVNAKYPNVEIKPIYYGELEKFKSEIEGIIKLLNDIECGVWYKEDIMNTVVDIVIIGSDEQKTRNKMSDIFDIKKDPMILKKYIPGIHLDKIDKIALDNEWWMEESQVRYDCYSLNFIQRLCEDKGHVYFTRLDMDDFFRKNNNFQNVSLKNIKNSIERLIYDGHIFDIVLSDNMNCYFYKEYYDKEVDIIRILERMKSITYPSLNLQKSDYPMDMTDEQIYANNGISENCISFLDGAGGTGKTGRCIKGICDILCGNLSEENDSTKVIFTAPTHAAKKNGKESIGYEKNINYNVLHSLLYTYYNEENEELNNLLTILRKNETRYIAVDETSMVDMPMFHELLTTIERYLSEGGDIHVVFMGDGNQLEPIGVGNPYISLLEKVPRFTLTKNFRSNEKIISFCNVILNNGPKGDNWYMDEKFQKKYNNDGVINFDFTDYETEWKSLLEKRLIELKERGFKPYEGEEGIEKEKTFQVICPWNYLNQNNISKDICIAIRRIFKGSDSKEVFEIGDVIIMNQNVKGLFYNNDLGRIVDIDIDGFEVELFETYPKPKGSKEEEEGYKHKGHRINMISYNRVKIPLTYKDATRNIFIKPNYSRTVHAVQGLQFSEILYVVPKQGGNFINIKMNYTAYSRAKDKLYLIGNKTAFDGYHSKRPSPPKNTTLPFEGDLNESIKKTLNGKSYTRIFQNSQTERSFGISKSLKYSQWEMDNGGIDGECRDCGKTITIKQFYISPINLAKKYELGNLKCVCSKCFNKFEI